MCMDDDHINLEPFFRDNISLKLAFEDGKIATGKKSRAFVDEKLPILKSILSKREVRAPGMFYTSGLPDMPLHHFSENEWTARLCGCLQESELNCTFKYTTDDCRVSTFAKTQRVATNIEDPVQCYPFIGAPDITVSTQNSILVSRADSNEVYTSGEESIENKKQCEPQCGDLPA